MIWKGKSEIGVYNIWIYVKCHQTASEYRLALNLIEIPIQRIFSCMCRHTYQSSFQLTTKVTRVSTQQRLIEYSRLKFAKLLGIYKNASLSNNSNEIWNIGCDFGTVDARAAIQPKNNFSLFHPWQYVGFRRNVPLEKGQYF